MGWRCSECDQHNEYRYKVANCVRCDHFNDILEDPEFTSLTKPPPQPLAATKSIPDLIQHYSLAMSDAVPSAPKEILDMVLSYLVLPIRIGGLVDAQDKFRKWYVGVVVDIKDEECLIHYPGWNRKWDEWVQIDGPAMRACGVCTIIANIGTRKNATDSRSRRTTACGFDEVKYLNCLRAVRLSCYAESRYFFLHGIPEKYKAEYLPELL